MKIYLKKTVWEAAIERINWLFDEFPNVVISTSGGKDSTVIMNLVLKVAEQRGRLPVPMLFLDQEAEYGSAIKYLRIAMADPRVKPLWIQCPFKIFNATSNTDQWLECWGEGQEWMREKEEISIKENVFGTDRFKQMFTNILSHYYPDEPAVYVAGVRAEESPQRAAGLTNYAAYKYATWGKVINKKLNHYTMYPIYDWTLSDVWKAIHSHGWPYCKIYDELWRYGIPPHKMRVSNLHHETAIHSLFWLHELEADTWEALTRRLGGINQTKHVSKNELFAVQKLPEIFKSWIEYRDYLTDKLITNEEHQKIFKRRWAQMDQLYGKMEFPEDLIKKQIGSLLVNDWEFAKLDGYLQSPALITYRKWRQGKLDRRKRPPATLKYIPESEWPK